MYLTLVKFKMAFTMAYRLFESFFFQPRNSEGSRTSKFDLRHAPAGAWRYTSLISDKVIKLIITWFFTFIESLSFCIDHVATTSPSCRRRRLVTSLSSLRRCPVFPDRPLLIWCPICIHRFVSLPFSALAYSTYS